MTPVKPILPRAGMLTKALFDSPKARPLRSRFRLLLHGFQSHYFRPQPLDLVGGFAHRGPGVQVNRNAGGLLTQPLHYVFRFLDHCSPSLVRPQWPQSAT
jgi:hypothetical protein